MRNLKRALSLAMASIMILGMMVVGASAASFNDFSDKDKVVNTDAVAILVELGVISGREDNTFDPTGIVTRAEMAKMICVVLNGGKDPQLGGATTNTYTDTVGHWASAYIEYCTNLNIVSGRGNGTFDPNATVTGQEAAKMLLAAAGYQAAIEGFTGANWAIATDVRANQVGLYAGLSASPATGISRDNAAQMVYNCLSVNTVTYKYTMAPDGKGGVVSVTELVTTEVNDSTKKLPTVLEAKFGAVKIVGVVTGNEIGTVGGGVQDKGVTYVEVTNKDEQTKITSGKFKMATDETVLGQSVIFYAKPSATNAANKAIVVGKPMVSADNVVYTTTAGVASDSKNTFKKLADDEDLSFTADTSFWTNFSEKGKFTENDKNANGVQVMLIDNDDDGKVDYALQNYSVFGKITAYNTKDKGSVTITATSVGTTNGLTYGFYDSDKGTFTKSSVKQDNSEKVIGFADVAKDDYVFVTEMGGKLYVEKAVSTELTPTSTKGNDFIAGGTTYKKAGTVNNVDAEGRSVLADAVDVGTSAAVYLDAYDYVTYVTDVDSTLRYLYVVGNTGANGVDDARAKVVFPDGTTSTVTVSKLDGSSTIPAGSLDGKIFSYTSSDKNYKLTSAANSNGAFSFGNINAEPAAAGDGYVIKGNANLKTDAGTKYANSNTIFVVENSNAWSVYTGISNVPTLKKPTGTAFVGVVAADKKDVAKVVYVSASSLSGSTALDKSLYFLNKNAEVTKDASGDFVYNYSVIYKGEKTTLKADTNLGLTKTGLYLNSTLNGSDVITDEGTYIAGFKANVAENGMITLDSTFSTTVNGVTKTYGPTFSVDDKTVVMAVDEDEVTVVDLGYITTGSAGDNVTVIPDKDNAARAAYIFVQE